MTDKLFEDGALSHDDKVKIAREVIEEFEGESTIMSIRKRQCELGKRYKQKIKEKLNK